MFKKILKWLAYFAIGIFLILIAFYFYLALQTGEQAKTYKVFADNKSKPLVIAHRGGRRIAPENTLEAFQKSVDLGVDVFELDIHTAKDGELIVIHDKSVDRTTNGKGKVAEMTLAEIQKLDAGHHWTDDEGKTFPYRGKDVRIPTLREVFEAFPDSLINIEPKHSEPSPVNKLCGLIKEFKRIDKVVVASTIKTVLTDFRRDCPGVATSASPTEAISFMVRYKLNLEDNYTPSMQSLQVIKSIGTWQFLTKGYMKAAHEKNLEVHVWTINKTEDMQKLIDVGVDGIITDYPDRLVELIGKNQ